MRYWLKFILCVHLSVYVILAPCVAHAAGLAVQSAPAISYGTSSATITPANIVSSASSDFQRLLQKPATIGGIVAEVADAIPAQVAGRAMTANLVRGLTAEAIARSALRISPYVTAGMIVYDMYNAYRVKSDGSGGLSVDDGQPTVPAAAFTCGVTNTVPVGSGSSAAGACSGFVANLNSAGYQNSHGAFSTCWTNYSYSLGQQSGNGFIVYEVISYQRNPAFPGPSCGDPSGSIAWGSANFGSTIIQQCPAVVDFSDPKYSVPGGPTGADGKCPTGRYHGATEDQIAPSMKAAPQIAADPVGVVKETLDKGVDIAPLSSPSKLTGPSTVAGPTSTSTTTKPDGTTQQVTTNTNYNVTYNTTNNSYSWTTSTTTSNSATGETTTDTKDSDDTGGSVSDPSLPDIPKLYDRKYPDGLVGVWNNASGAFKQTPIFRFLASVVPGMGDGGCPQWSLPVMYSTRNYSMADISLPCWVWAALRGFMVCTALLTSRKLIFGG